MLTIVWEYRVAAGREAEFTGFYGDAGPWVRLFRTAPGYLGTSLLRDVARDGVYVTLDRWETAAAFESFRAQHAAEYARLDGEAAALTAEERRLGAFES